MDFNWESDVKNNYLMTIATETAKSYSMVLQVVDNTEQELQKSIYNFSLSEIEEMIVTRFNIKSPRTLDNKTSIIRMYVQYCIDNKLVPHNENRLSMLIQGQDRFVNISAFKSRYLSEDQIQECIDMLYNYQDKAIIKCPYLGIRGRTSISNSCEEMINFQINENSKDTKNNTLRLEKNNGEVRFLKVSNYDMNIFLEAKNETVYVANNGEAIENFKGGIKNLAVNKCGDYVFRKLGANIHEPLDSSSIITKINRIKKYIGNPYITITSLYESGMINTGLRIMKEQNRDLTKYDYIDIAAQFEYGNQPDQYWSIVKKLITKHLELYKGE